MAKFRRASQQSWLGGVCAGLAYTVGVPVWVVRLVWFLSMWFWSISLCTYILLWIFIPTWEKVPEDFASRTND